MLSCHVPFILFPPMVISCRTYSIISKQEINIDISTQLIQISSVLCAVICVCVLLHTKYIDLCNFTTMKIQNVSNTIRLPLIIFLVIACSFSFLLLRVFVRQTLILMKPIFITFSFYELCL